MEGREKLFERERHHERAPGWHSCELDSALLPDETTQYSLKKFISMEDSIKMELTWISTESQPGLPYRYPNPPTPLFKETFSGPGIYRWAIFERDLLTEIYIGEAENVYRRLGGYLRPGSKQQTNIRVKQTLEQKIAIGATIRFQVLEFKPFRLNEIVISKETLTNPYVRKILENVAILLCCKETLRVINRGVDLTDKTLDKIQSLFPDSKTTEREQFVHAHGKY